MSTQATTSKILSASENPRRKGIDPNIVLGIASLIIAVLGVKISYDVSIDKSTINKQDTTIMHLDDLITRQDSSLQNQNKELAKLDEEVKILKHAAYGIDTAKVILQNNSKLNKKDRAEIEDLKYVKRIFDEMIGRNEYELKNPHVTIGHKRDYCLYSVELFNRIRKVKLMNADIQAANEMNSLWLGFKILDHQVRDKTITDNDVELHYRTLLDKYEPELFDFLKNYIKSKGQELGRPMI